MGRILADAWQPVEGNADHTVIRKTRKAVKMSHQKEQHTHTLLLRQRFEMGWLVCGWGRERRGEDDNPKMPPTSH